MIAGIIQAASRQSPYVNMEAAKRRRAYVLQRMADLHDITQEQANAAKAKPIVLRGSGRTTIAPYFLEEAQAARDAVRREAAVRRRALRADDARQRPAGDGQPGDE
jgi:membrane peptidoglycan carboxypeptidase